MTDAKHARLPPALVELISGLTAGTTATLIVHPLDIVKTRMQIYRSPANPSTAPLTTMNLLREMARTDRPVRALYRGIAPNLLGNATSWATFFFFKARFEDGLLAWKSPNNTTPASPSSSPAAPARLGPSDFFLASAGAGAMTQLVTNPIWVIKTRMVSTDSSAPGAYTSMLSGAVRIFRAEGFLGFYRGLGVGLLNISHGAVQFAVYDPAKRAWLAWQGERALLSSPKGTRLKSGNDQHLSNEATLAISTISKFVAGTATYPLQVLRSRLQQDNAEEQFGRGIRGVVARVWREEGFRGFYRGLMPGVVRVLPATWITFLVYENVRWYLPRWADGV